MKSNLRNLVLAIASVGLVACGGDDSETPEEVEEIECGENTVEVDGECVADVECGEGETATNDGRCVFSDYCGDDTTFNPGPGRCEADADLACGDQTVEEDGECLVDYVISCGEGTVVADESCRPSEEVCGDGSDPDNQQQCRPVEDICGDGTAFDFNQRVCVPLSFLECGPGTTDDEGTCIPSSIFYEDLATTADLDLDGEASTEITLKDQGERFIFTGTIDVPEVEDDELLSNQDSLSFDAQPGQWLRIGLYSLGLPTPGFHLFDEEESFSRLSDLGGGVEVVRDVVIPREDSYELLISSLSQLRDELDYTGGEDWDYVGFIEVIEAPEARTIDIEEETFSGDIRDLQDNFYHIEDIDADASLAMLFSDLPLAADAELQIWSDATTLDQTLELTESSLAFDAPGESFYVLFDRAHAFGNDTDYSATAQTGGALEDGGTLTMDVDLEAGEYIGISQFNLAELPISAAITDGTDTLASTSELNISNANFGQLALYYYAPTDTTVTLEWENTTEEDLEFFSTSYQVGEAEFQDGIDGEPVQFSSDVNLTRGHRHYVELEVDVAEQLPMEFSISGGSAQLYLFDADGEELTEGIGSVVHGTDSGTYLLAVEAVNNMPSGFSLTIEETRTFTASETNVTIPAASGFWPNSTPSPVYLELTVPDGCIVESIEAHLSTESGLYNEDTAVNLFTPDETEYRLYSLDTGSGSSSFELTFPTVDSPVDPLEELIGEDGGGVWELEFLYIWTSSATLAEWSLSVECE